MIIDEDSKRKEIQVYDGQCKVWYDFLVSQTNKVSNYFKDTRQDLNVQKGYLEERLAELNRQYDDNNVAKYDLLDSISQMEYSLEVFDQEIQQLEREMDQEIENKDNFSRETLVKEKEELIKGICDVKLIKADEWLKNIKKDLPDGEIKDLLKICFKLFYGAKQFSIEEFIENVLSKNTSKTDIETPLEWAKEKLQSNDKIKYNLSQFLAKFANYNRQDLTKETRIILKQYIEQQQPLKQSKEIQSIVNLLIRFNKWEIAACEYDQIEKRIKLLEQLLEEKRKAPEYQHYNDYLKFLEQEKEIIEQALNLIETNRNLIESTFEALDGFYEYQDEHREQIQSTITYETRNDEKLLIYQEKEQQIEMK